MFGKFLKAIKKTSPPEADLELSRGVTPELAPHQQDYLRLVGETLERNKDLRFPVHPPILERSNLAQEVDYYIQHNYFIPTELVLELLVSTQNFFTVTQTHPNWPRYLEINQVAPAFTIDLTSRMYRYNPNGVQLLITSLWNFNDICSTYLPHLNSTNPRAAFISARKNPGLDNADEAGLPTTPKVTIRIFPPDAQKTMDIHPSSLEFLLLNLQTMISKLPEVVFDPKEFEEESSRAKPLETNPGTSNPYLIPQDEPSSSPQTHTPTPEEITLGGSKSQEKPEMAFLKIGTKGFVKLGPQIDPTEVLIVDIGERMVTIETFHGVPQDMRQTISKHYPEILKEYPELFQECAEDAAILLESAGCQDLSQGLSWQQTTAFMVSRNELTIDMNANRTPQSPHVPVFLNPLYFRVNSSQIDQLKSLSQAYQIQKI